MAEEWSVLFPVFVTSPSVTPEIIDEFLEAATNDDLWHPERSGPHNFALLRNHADGEQALSRAEGSDEVSGAQPPTSPNGQLDFVGSTVDDLAKYVIEHFDPFQDMNDRLNPEEPNPQTGLGAINDGYFVVLDERSAQDQTVLIVSIPVQSNSDPKSGDTYRYRRWVKRESYINEDDDEGRDMADNELEAMRVRWEVAANVELFAQGLGPPTTTFRREAIKEGIKQT